MARPTSRDVHIDAALSNISIAYKNETYIWDQVFPIVPVEKRSDEYFVYPKAYWFADEAQQRSPGTRAARGGYTVSSCTYTTQEYAIGKAVPDEVRDNADDPIKPEIESVEYVTDKILLRLERDVAGNVFGDHWSGSATPSPTWDDDTSDPLRDVQDAISTFIATIGRKPNVGVMGYQVLSDLKLHPDILDRIKYTERGIVTEALLASLFGLDKLLVGTAIYNSAAEEVTAVLAYIWGKDFWLGYVPPSPGLMIPAAGYVFEWQARQVERFREDQEKQDIFTASMNWDVELTAADAGYKLVSVVA